jgi:hypothetical protein
MVRHSWRRLVTLEMYDSKPPNRRRRGAVDRRVDEEIDLGRSLTFPSGHRRQADDLREQS